MSKKRNNNMTVLDIPDKGTILEQFETFIEKHKKKSDIIYFLSIMNARSLLWGNNIPENMVQEIIEFTAYFEENFYAFVYEEVMENWGDDPRILQIGDYLIEQEYKKFADERIKNADTKIKKEAQTLADTLYQIREYRIISYVFVSNDGDMEQYGLEIPKTVYKMELEDMRKDLLIACLDVIEGNGAMTVRLRKTDHDEIFGIRVLPNRMWIPVDKDSMKKAHLTGPDGIEFEPEDNVVYTEIQREIF